jgi:hypothetical protein
MGNRIKDQRRRMKDRRQRGYNAAMRWFDLCRVAALGVAILAPLASAQTSRPADRRAVVTTRFRVGQRVEVLHGDEWRLATVLGFDADKLRIRTDANEEQLVRPVELRRFTNARSYPIKAAPEDVVRINPPPPKDAITGERPAEQLKPGLTQPAEPEPQKEKVKVVEAQPPIEEVRRARDEIPLPPAPNLLPGDIPVGDLSNATPLAAPEKVTSLATFGPDPAAGWPRPVTTKTLPLRSLDSRDAVFEVTAPLLFAAPEFAHAFVPHRDRSVDAPTNLYYDRYDLTTGQRNGGFAVPPSGKVLDLSPDGTRLLLSWTSQDGGGVQEDCLGVFIVLNDRLQIRSAWRPYASIRGETAKGVETARFTDNAHVLTSGGSDLTMWDVEARRAGYRLYPIAPFKIAVSPPESTSHSCPARPRGFST